MDWLRLAEVSPSFPLALLLAASELRLGESSVDGVGGPDVSVVDGVSSKAFLGRGRRTRPSEAIVAKTVS